MGFTGIIIRKTNVLAYKVVQNKLNIFKHILENTHHSHNEVYLEIQNKYKMTIQNRKIY